MIRKLTMIQKLTMIRDDDPDADNEPCLCDVNNPFTTSSWIDGSKMLKNVAVNQSFLNIKCLYIPSTPISISKYGI